MSRRGIFCLSGVGTHKEGVCERLGLVDLTRVPEELATMRRALTSLGLEEHLPFDTEEREHDVLARELNNSEAPQDARTLVVYCTGHGIQGDHGFELLLSDGYSEEPARLIKSLGQEKWRNLQEIVLIIDACSAEPGLDAALIEARKANTWTSLKGFWGIGASRRLEQATQGSFATAFAEAVERAVRPSWNISHLDPGTLATTVNEALGPNQNVWLAEGHPAEPCRALPNPLHQNPRPPTGLSLPATWAARARGVAAPDLPGFFFTGRTALLAELRAHLTATDDSDPLTAVTGSPGTGKSALLGHLALTTGAMAGRGDPQHLLEMVRAAPKPLALVLDDLDSPDSPDNPDETTTTPEQWTEFLSTLRSIEGVRAVLALPATSRIPLPATTHHLDDLQDESAAAIRSYLDRQIRLTVPGAREKDIAETLDSLAPHAGSEWPVAVGVTLPRVTKDTRSIRDYQARATRELDATAHRVCRERVGAVLGGDKARAIVSALAALCGYDDTVALPALEWAAAAAVETQDVLTAVPLMRSLVESRPAEDGTPRWRARFGHPEGGGHAKPEEFLQRLPQVGGWREVEWRTLDPGLLALVSDAAARGLIDGRLVDEPAFLLGVPPGVASRAIRRLGAKGDSRADLARRARMWQLVPRTAPDADRALLLRVGAERFDVKPVVNAFRTGRPRTPVEWVQPDRSRTTRLTAMTATSAAVVSVYDDDSLSFHDPADGTVLRPPVPVPGTPRDVTVAVVRDRPVALVSTWRHEIWRVACDEDTAPVLVPELVPPRGEQSPLLVSLHPGGQVVVAAGPEVWTGGLDTGAAVRRLALLDTDVLAVRTAGEAAEPVVWLVPASGRLRRLRLGEVPGPAVSPFPVPHRPLAVAVSEGGDQALIVDTAGGLQLRGAGWEGVVLTPPPGAGTLAAALDGSTVVVGGPVGRAGWLDVHRPARAAAPARLPLDDAAVAVALHGKDRLIVARTCGLLSLNLAGPHD
ncbi:ATP-binding protein [Streptomyces fulvoviolaceus]|uniref:ATP-binding protein n=1 Tax=Streptomyces fulvoviolaceus TaxID=285535 RepID=UPI0021C01FE0|nr:ATP-binding protein [Streptomyces fulvoviolaceus]MCT9075078.1 ATP-binding protein [Streptomyces fulvoviolaceus]